MTRDRRGSPRYVTDGLNISVDGAVHVVLDVALSSVRVLRRDQLASAPLCVQLHFWNDPDKPPIDFSCPGFLIRETASELVFGFTSPSPDWNWKILLFDTFANHTMANLEL
jgi:hypothetical protein